MTTIIHDLTDSELADLASMVKRGRSSWRWVYGADDSIRNCCIEIEGSHVVRAEASTDHAPAQIVRGIYDALKRERQRRSEAARRAANTRAERRDRMVYSPARYYLDRGAFPPAGKCRICGRKLSDQESISRGIGAECWQGVLRTTTTMEKQRSTEGGAKG
jgi:hypothetical protein